MLEVILERGPSTDQGTIGKILINGQRYCYLIELPDRGNEPTFSRIPAGRYTCVWHKSPKYGMVYLVTGVAGRSLILTHWGNVAGDREKGFKTHSWGCLLFGKYVGRLKGQLAVLSSRPTVKKFFREMNRQTFMLQVV